MAKALPAGTRSLTTREFCRLIERISQADGSAGWVASFGIGGIYLAALPWRLWKSSMPTAPTWSLPAASSAAARRRGGRWLQVNGRWSWGSGSMNAEVVGAGILPKNGDGSGLTAHGRDARGRSRSLPELEVMGLLGTGNRHRGQDVVVPRWTFVRGGPASLDTPLTATRPCPSRPRC